MPIEANMMLAEASRIHGGSLSLLGAGWVTADPDPSKESPYGIGIVLSIPRDEVGTEHETRIELQHFGVDEQVTLKPPYGDGPLVVTAGFTAEGRPDKDLLVPVTVVLALNFPAFPLEPSSAYQWRLFVDGETRDHWVLPFRSSPP